MPDTNPYADPWELAKAEALEAEQAKSVEGATLEEPPPPPIEEEPVVEEPKPKPARKRRPRAKKKN